MDKSKIIPVSNHQRASYSPSFTLIELLVVVAIIGLLSGMVVISLNGAKERAQIAKGIAFSDSLRNSLMLNLISEWKFDENQGTTAYDTWAKYNPNNGTLVNGPVWKSGSECVSGSCLQFDGVDDHVNVLHSSFLSIGNTNQLSICVWVYNRDTGGEWRGIITKNREGGGSSTQVYGIWRDASTPGRWYFRSGNSACSTDKAAVNEWTFLCMTIIKGFTSKGYVNGSLACSWLDNSTDGTYDFKIGRAGGASEYFNGFIDEVRIYNAALPSAQIKQHYVQGLQNLLVNKAISYQEYNQRMAEFSQTLAVKQ